MKCDECFGLIDSKSGFCTSCGLEVANFKEIRFNNSVLHGTKESGEYESRDRKSRKAHQYGSRRGYSCILCREMLSSISRPDVDEGTLDIESRSQGFEIPGTDFTRFLLHHELEDHIKIIHGGRKEYWRKIHDKKRMTKIRELDTLNKETSVSSLRRGQGK